LREGSAEQSAAQLRDALAATTDPLARSGLLPTAVEAMIASGDMTGAHKAVDELQQLAEAHSVPIVRARAHQAAGALLLAEGAQGAASTEVAQAIAAWKQVVAPYDVARCQVILALTDSTQRELHLRSALETFKRLGAVADARRVEQLLGHADHVEQVTRTFMFTDIEGSTALLAELGDAAWVSVLERHHATLRALIGRFGGEEVTDTGDGLFVAFVDADGALQCALAIQGAIEDVRVRIGVHHAEATRHDRQYCGRGVHEAARISAIGGGGDIVASAATLVGVREQYTTRQEQSVELKGLPGRMDIVFLEAR
jgi:class 3 adenylate cyclase